MNNKRTLFSALISLILLYRFFARFALRNNARDAKLLQKQLKPFQTSVGLFINTWFHFETAMSLTQTLSDLQMEIVYATTDDATLESRKRDVYARQFPHVKLVKDSGQILDTVFVLTWYAQWGEGQDYWKHEFLKRHSGKRIVLLYHGLDREPAAIPSGALGLSVGRHSFNKFNMSTYFPVQLWESNDLIKDPVIVFLVQGNLELKRRDYAALRQVLDHDSMKPFLGKFIVRIVGRSFDVPPEMLNHSSMRVSASNLDDASFYALCKTASYLLPLLLPEKQSSYFDGKLSSGVSVAISLNIPIIGHVKLQELYNLPNSVYIPYMTHNIESKDSLLSGMIKALTMSEQEWVSAREGYFEYVSSAERRNVENLEQAMTLF
jgi:hypothetical protein